MSTSDGSKAPSSDGTPNFFFGPTSFSSSSDANGLNSAKDSRPSPAATSIGISSIPHKEEILLFLFPFRPLNASILSISDPFYKGNHVKCPLEMMRA